MNRVDEADIFVTILHFETLAISLECLNVWGMWALMQGPSSRNRATLLQVQ